MSTVVQSSAGQRVTQAKVVRSEWTKLRSQPSTAWSLLSAVALVVGFGVLYSLVRVTRPPRTPADMASFDPTAISLAGVQLAQIAVAVLGSALYLTAVGLLGLGLGALLRNTAGATASLFGVLFGLQIVVGFLPATLADKIARYLPTPAGVAVTNVQPDPASLGPWAGFGLFCLYTAIVLGLAAWLLRRRDV